MTMGANVGPVDGSEPNKILTAMKVARDLIDRRGYQPVWSKGYGDPLNISEALTRACDDYETYLRARQSFSKTWGGVVSGLLNWETEKRRTKAEVLKLFDAAMERLENGEAHPTGGYGPGGSGPGIT